MTTDPAAQLKDRILAVDEVVQKMWNDIGACERIWTLWNDQGDLAMLPAPPAPTKDVETAFMVVLFRKMDIACYVLVDEAWILDGKGKEELDKVFREGRTIRNHPDRKEVVMFSAENRYGQIMAKREIIRPADGSKATLGPLDIDDRFMKFGEGRLVGLLQPEGSA